jgi:hypothetical protein
MTKNYISTKIITAWKSEKDGQEGYAVKYEDGYTSWSPKAVFEAAYRAIEGAAQALTFGDVVVMLKAGKRVARAGWNGDGMFIYLVAAASYPVQTDVASAWYGAGSMVPYNAYFALKGVDNKISTWVPSISDCLADDWYTL